MLDDAETKARRLVADLERDAADINQSSSLSEAQRAKGRGAIERALTAARHLLQALQNAAESEKLR